jgi:hypothetical protein
MEREDTQPDGLRSRGDPTGVRKEYSGGSTGQAALITKWQVFAAVKSTTRQPLGESGTVKD